MATTQGLIDRLRLELSDTRAPFVATLAGDGATVRFELPHSPVEPDGLLVVKTDSSGSADVLSSAYELDSDGGVLIFDVAPAVGDVLSVSGTATRWFTDADLTVFINTAFTQHTHGRNLTLGTLPLVEDYLLVLLANIEALYSLLNDAAFDIDVNTPEGVSIPRAQRFRQIMQLIEQRKEQYTELSQALNVGLHRVEMTTLRRVSRTTGRLVPLYVDRELEDASPPRRIHVPVDLQGAKPIPDPVQVYDLYVEQGIPITVDIDTNADLTGKTVRAQLRRAELAGPLVYFDVTVTDLVQGLVTIELRDTSRHRIWFDGDLFWDMRVIDPVSPTYSNVSQTLVKGKVYVIERPRI